jgi:hypothetical protein
MKFEVTWLSGAQADMIEAYAHLGDEFYRRVDKAGWSPDSVSGNRSHLLGTISPTGPDRHALWAVLLY